MPQPEIVLIAALAEGNRVIGKGGKVPWKIPADSQRFRQLTLGYPVIMGRKTWMLDLEQRPLDQRHNIVVSSSIVSGPLPDLGNGTKLTFVCSLGEALETVARLDRVFIVGGASIYTQSLPLADTLELTFVAGCFDGDTYFPEYATCLATHFDLVQREAHSGYRFDTYRRHQRVAG